MEERTNVQVMDSSRQIYRDEGGFFVYLDVYAEPVTHTGVKAYINDEDVDRLKLVPKQERSWRFKS